MYLTTHSKTDVNLGKVPCSTKPKKIMVSKYKFNLSFMLMDKLEYVNVSSIPCLKYIDRRIGVDGGLLSMCYVLVVELLLCVG